MVRIGSARKKITEVGEEGLIRGIRNLIRASRAADYFVEIGPGDDAAVWRPRPNHSLVMTTDMLVENVHFRHNWSNAESIGIRSLAVNVSDIAGMGARPRVAVISLGLRGDETDRWVYEFYRGALSVAERHKFRIIGGDIVSSPRGTVIGVTVEGELSPRKPALRRDCAKPGDVIGVTGPIGLAAAGVRILSDDNLKLEGSPRMIEAHRRPQPRVMQGILLRWAGVTCGMDLSDGLLGDLPRICTASEVAATIEQERLPIPNAVRWGFDDWLDLALRGGEDFELLFTCTPDHFQAVESLFRRWGCPPPVKIGRIDEAREDGAQVRMLRPDRRQVDLEPGAYEHFATRP